MENLHLIVGLGNPGRAYARTRHNAGFLVLERLAHQWRSGWQMNRGFESRVTLVTDGDRRVLLAQPQTYMNLSGQAVARLVDYYRVGLERLLVILDDADLPVGALRMRSRGSSGGHHGLESIEARLGTREYARMRVGIGGRDEGPREITGHVLGRFGAAEAARMERVFERAAEQAMCWLREGVSVAMSRYNGMVEQTEQEATE
jgi:peptidyl-tRNA hydrolase, PTH1 family